MMRLIVPIIIIWVLVFITSSSGDEDKVVCTNCGHKFRKTFINILCSELSTYLHPRPNYLKCPKCKVRDECSTLYGR